MKRVDFETHMTDILWGQYEWYRRWRGGVWYKVKFSEPQNTFGFMWTLTVPRRLSRILKIEKYKKVRESKFEENGEKNEA